MYRSIAWLSSISLVAACTTGHPESTRVPTALDDAPAPAVPIPQGSEGHDRYLAARAGYYLPSSSELDDGYLVNAAYGWNLSRLFAFELEGGYFKADGSSGSAVDTIEGIPLMVNARVTLPVLFLEAYGGGGVGTIYYNAKGVVPGTSQDGWLFAGSVFLGADFALLDTVTLGLEARYYLTEMIGDEDLDAFAAFATLGVRF